MPSMAGILKAAAKTYFNSELQIKVVSIKSEKVGEGVGMREHVIFSITVEQAGLNDGDEPPPTFIAQTNKNGEKQILKRVKCVFAFFSNRFYYSDTFIINIMTVLENNNLK